MGVIIDRRAIERAAGALAERAVEAARALTREGRAIDDHQVVVERVAYAASEARVIAELAAVPEELADVAGCAAAELAASIPHRLAPVAAVLGLGPVAPGYDGDADAAAAIATGIAPAAVERVGEAAIAARGRLAWPLDETLAEIRANVRAFADREVAPHAE